MRFAIARGKLVESKPMKTVFLLALAWAVFPGDPARTEEAESIRTPFAGDPEWMTAFPEAQLCQIAGGKPILILVWMDSDSRTQRLEKNLAGWTGVKEALAAYCKVHLPVEANRDFVNSLGVTRAPCLVSIASDPLRPVKNRVTGILEDLEESQSVLAFLQLSILGEMMGEAPAHSSEPAPLRLLSATELLQEAERADAADRPLEALEMYQEAVDKIPSASRETRRDLYIKIGDLAYALGQLQEALDAYREAEELLLVSERGEDVLRALYWLALLLNDAGDNEAAVKAIDERIESEQDPEEIERLKKIKAAIEVGLFVLADMGYPGAGARLPGGDSAREDLGDPDLSFEERLAQANGDLDRLASLLDKRFVEKGTYPEFLDEIPDLTPPEEKAPKDPFFKDSFYHYLHFQDPEGYVLYSIGPDGMDQTGLEEFDPQEGEEGKGDLIRKR